MVDSLSPDAAKVAALREALPATGAGMYLDTATRGPLPAETAAAMREADDWELRVGRVTAGRSEDAEQRADEARAVLAALVTGQPDEMAVLPGLGLALSVAAWAPDWRPGDRALTTSHEGPAVRAALAAVGRRLGVQVDVADIPDDADAQVAQELLASALTARTKLLMISAVSPMTGLRMPLVEIGELARQRGAWLAVDGSQAVAAMAVAAPELGIDFLAFPGDAWALGPEGTAGLWAGPRAAAEGRVAFSRPAALEAAGARRFEVADLPRTSLVGLARSVSWLAMYVGLEWALDRANGLAGMVHEALTNVAGVEVLTPRLGRAAIVAFRVAGWSAEEVADELGRRVFAILSTLPALDAVRASICWFNTQEELERLVEAVTLLAAHTPATLPRRPSLVVMPAGFTPDADA
ncbi:aminotransferase class V-fold PLP-dependent enzyme [soil metagenome]